MSAHWNTKLYHYTSKESAIAIAQSGEFITDLHYGAQDRCANFVYSRGGHNNTPYACEVVMYFKWFGELAIITNDQSDVNRMHPNTAYICGWRTAIVAPNDAHLTLMAIYDLGASVPMKSFEHIGGLPIKVVNSTSTSNAI